MKVYSTRCGGIYLFKTIPEAKDKKTDANKGQPSTDKKPSIDTQSIEKTCLNLFKSSFSPLKKTAPSLCQWVGSTFQKSITKAASSTKEPPQLGS
jgi:hypothetical protein